MKRIFGFLLILSLLSLSYASAQGYGGNLRGLTEIDLNVTVVNTAEYPKFVVVNPNYRFEVFRNGSNPRQLNGATGFWIMPYETVKVNFRITENSTYPVSVPSCGEDEFMCGVVYPPLINYPKIRSLASLFPFIDGDIRILKVEGTVTLNVTNPAGGNAFFAIAPPVLFEGARTYAYYPNYTMNYSEYAKDFIRRFGGVKPAMREKPRKLEVKTTLFRVTPALLSGVRVPRVERYPKKVAKLDFPVWIVFMRKSVVITYRVSWTNSGR